MTQKLDLLKPKKTNSFKIKGVTFKVRNPSFDELFVVRGSPNRIIRWIKTQLGIYNPEEPDLRHRPLDELLSKVIVNPKFSRNEIKNLDSEVVEKIIENIPKAKEHYLKVEEPVTTPNERVNYFG